MSQTSEFSPSGVVGTRPLWQVQITLPTNYKQLGNCLGCGHGNTFRKINVPFPRSQLTALLPSKPFAVSHTPTWGGLEGWLVTTYKQKGHNMWCGALGPDGKGYLVAPKLVNT